MQAMKLVHRPRRGVRRAETPRHEPQFDHLFDLPPELQLRIVHFLTWAEIKSLRLACSRIAATIIGKDDLMPTRKQCYNVVRAQEVEQAESIKIGMPSEWSATQLPCYTCLRWLPSGGDLLSSSFTRGKGTGLYGPGGGRSHLRICTACGVRKGIFLKGTRVGYLGICYNCEKLTATARPTGLISEREDFMTYTGIDEGNEYKKDPRWVLRPRTYRRWAPEYCWPCLKLDEVLCAAQDITHERRWGKYEEGMRIGKAYRWQKGAEIRRMIGIHAPDLDQYKPYVSKHVCPVMQESRLCTCWRVLKGKEVELISAKKQLKLGDG